VLDGVDRLLPRTSAPEVVRRNDYALLRSPASGLERGVVVLERVICEELLVPALLQKISRDDVVGIDVIAELLRDLTPDLQTLIHLGMALGLPLFPRPQLPLRRLATRDR